MDFFAPTLYDQLVIVISRGGHLVWRSEGANPDRGTVFVGGDANPLGHYVCNYLTEGENEQDNIKLTDSPRSGRIAPRCRLLLPSRQIRLLPSHTRRNRISDFSRRIPGRSAVPVVVAGVRVGVDVTDALSWSFFFREGIESRVFARVITGRGIREPVVFSEFRNNARGILEDFTDVVTSSKSVCVDMLQDVVVVVCEQFESVGDEGVEEVFLIVLCCCCCYCYCWL